MGSRREKAERALGSWHAVSGYWMAFARRLACVRSCSRACWESRHGHGVGMDVHGMADTWHVHTYIHTCVHTGDTALLVGCQAAAMTDGLQGFRLDAALDAACEGRAVQTGTVAEAALRRGPSPYSKG
jgi:hypothetical protein